MAGKKQQQEGKAGGKVRQTQDSRHNRDALSVLGFPLCQISSGGTPSLDPKLQKLASERELALRCWGPVTASLY